MFDSEAEAGAILEKKNGSGAPDLDIDGSSEFRGVHVDRELNLKGKVCPYTFVESMLALEEMEIGEVLRVIIDYAPSACDVPKSLAREGYEILEVNKINETDWSICVKNRPYEG
jgi:tRNA 2-thiouridine synthesizing protein A